MTSTSGPVYIPPIHRLPQEMLSEIFSHAIPSKYIILGNNTIPDTRNSFIISYVCQKWKRVIESTSSFWSRVVLDLDDVPEDSSMTHSILACVQRCAKLTTMTSKERKFSFTARGTSPHDAKIITEVLFHVLTSIPSRLASLGLHCFRGDVFNSEYNRWVAENNLGNPHRQVVQLVNRGLISFPVLKELIMLRPSCDMPTTNQFDFPTHFTQLFRDAPLLRHISLDSIRSLDGLNWSYITNLTISKIYYSSQAFSHYANVFPKMGNLESLELSFIQRSPGYCSRDSINTNDKAIWENLKTLKIVTFVDKRFEQVCRDTPHFRINVGEIDLYRILGTIPLVKNLERLYVRTYYIRSEDFVHNQRVVEEPVGSYLIKSECIARSHMQVRVRKYTDHTRDDAPDYEKFEFVEVYIGEPEANNY